MHVEALLRQKGSFVATIHPDAPLTEALADLADQGVGALVVSVNGRTVDGILSERDIVRELHRLGAPALEGVVGALMSRDVLTCAPGDEIASLMQVMTDRRVRHLPVVEDGALLGIVSIGDVVKQRVGELEDDRRALHEYITAR